jgi:hypothetical protein
LAKKSDNEQPKTVRLYKSEMCKAFVELGTCKFGDRCQFAHTKEELRNVPRSDKYKTRKCKKFFEDGICPYGSRCSFLHTEPSPQSSSAEQFNLTLTPSPVDNKKIFDYKMISLVDDSSMDLLNDRSSIDSYETSSLDEFDATCFKSEQQQIPENISLFLPTSLLLFHQNQQPAASPINRDRFSS